MTTPSKEKLFQVTKKALLTGGEVLRRGFSKTRRVSYKTAVSPVTQVDRLSEKKIIGLIRKNIKGHSFLAEESSFLQKGDIARSHPDRYRWIIDPLDGTINYIHGVPQSCVSVAVERGGTVLVGGVYDPFRDELYMAVRGKGSRKNGRRIRVSKESKLIHSLIITGFPYDRQKNANYYLSLIEPFLKKAGGVRRFGSAAIDLAWVASGRAEGFWESKLSPWDVAAGLLLVEEAGGKVTTYRGKPYNFDYPTETLASNGRLHPKLVQIFKK